MTRSTIALILALTLPLAAPLPSHAVTQESRASATTQTVNINTATATQLEALPGIGPSMAQRIVTHREKNGPFKKLEDLMQIQGIGEKSFLKLRQYLTIGGQADARPTAK